jgi:hypothetical protein
MTKRPMCMMIFLAFFAGRLISTVQGINATKQIRFLVLNS